MSEVVVSFSHLPQCESVVEGRDWDVTTVDDLCPLLVGIDAGSWVKASEAGLTGTGSPNSTRSKTCTRAVGYRRVEWCSKDGNVIFLLWMLQASRVRKMSKG